MNDQYLQTKSSKFYHRQFGDDAGQTMQPQMQGDMGYSWLKPFEYIYRHHRRYRMTEGAELIQIRVKD
ncbi:hypothetical protein MNBD_ALPHA04-959 [hydrothermal vent metagenome]|uniref:Uncharacterized protein n=1 Tax=hydrothermal vent metagenome TaxID=652676 RepID=A0A3B0RM85_9ZZZZ